MLASKSMMSPTGSMTHAIPDSVLREIVVMRVLHHPNIVKLVEIIDDLESDKFYVIMEYCERGPLHTLGHAPLSLDSLRTKGQHVLRGLRYLHDHGLYHRDIKPANCLVDSDGVAKLADFGACDMKHISNYTDGTPAFMCPEMMRGEEVDGVIADSWAFAVTMYQAAYGVLPFPTLNYNAIQQLLASEDEIPFPPSSTEEGENTTNASNHLQTDAQQLESLLRSMLVKDITHRCKIDDAIRHPFFGSMDAIIGSSVRRSPDNSDHDRSRSIDMSRESNCDRPPLSGIPVITVDDQPPPPMQPPHPHNISDSGTAPFHAYVEDPLATSVEGRAELYARALLLVKKGNKVHQSFHGLHRVKEARRKSLAVIQRFNFDGDEVNDEIDQSSLWSPVRKPLQVAAEPGKLSPFDKGVQSVPEAADPTDEPREQQRTPLLVSPVNDSITPTQEGATSVPGSPLSPLNRNKGRRRSTVTTITAASSAAMNTRTRREEAKLEKIVDRLIHSSNTTQAHIKGIALGNNVPDQLSEVLQLNIKSLAITDCRLSVLRGLHMPAFTNLRDLNLSKNNFHVFPVEVLHSCPKLQLLDMSFNRIKTIPDELSHAPFLERLSLHFNRVCQFTAVSLTGKNFHHLRLSDNPVAQLPQDNTSAFTNVKVVLDDAPVLMQQWTEMLISQRSGGLSIIWNDVYPKQMLPGYPWFVAPNPLALYSVHQLRQLNIKHIVVPDVIRKYRRYLNLGGGNESDDSMRSTSVSSVSSSASGTAGWQRRASKRRKTNADGLPLSLKIPLLHPSAEKLFSGIHFVDTHGFIGPNHKPLSQLLVELHQQDGGNIMLCIDESLPSSIGSTEEEQAEISHHHRVIVASILDVAAKVTSFSPSDIREALSEARLGFYN
ncbi:calcium calmodulin-dependent protein kinase, putative [Bodo saltans]|uniref:Calcium calmodulin-dependent protein kinase, putative n=1 Tax=Bodo saltans TaxID=75058 RepID=A0A0S4JI48_BODSA|nr:calcium calmodulin-dependent protein kinase, putative [Bodo saltans]|eukprot:CUG91147.1 calcium calmodulin-dependent protein kinase, putative [Bodo saltans]